MRILRFAQDDNMMRAFVQRPVALLALGWSVALPAQAPARAGSVPAARFTDPDRVTKLTSSFADIDRVFSQYAEREHIPGAVWGIIIDGRLAHVGVTG